MKQYHDLLKNVLTEGKYKPNRTGVDTLSYFAGFYKVDLTKGFPLLTTKKVFLRGIIHELIWYLRGDSNIKYLIDNDLHFWDDNAFDKYLKDAKKNKDLNSNFCQDYFTVAQTKSAEWLSAQQGFIQKIKQDSEFAKQYGDLGPVYGKLWRNWQSTDLETGKIVKVDQIADALQLLKNNPNSRRILVTAWDPGNIKHMALPSCHCMFNFNVLDNKLNLHLTQRSCDVGLGVPFNTASYALLTQVFAQQVGLEMGEFAHTLVDLHIYCGDGENYGLKQRGKWYQQNLTSLQDKVKGVSIFDTKADYLKIKSWIEENAPAESKKRLDHVPGLLLQLSREIKLLPQMQIANKPYEQLTIDDFVLSNYEPSPGIKFEMAV